MLRRCVCDLETSRMGAPYIYDISHLRFKLDFDFLGIVQHMQYSCNVLCKSGLAHVCSSKYFNVCEEAKLFGSTSPYL